MTLQGELTNKYEFICPMLQNIKFKVIIIN
jgi:hypothetical protein